MQLHIVDNVIHKQNRQYMSDKSESQKLLHTANKKYTIDNSTQPSAWHGDRKKL